MCVIPASAREMSKGPHGDGSDGFGGKMGETRVGKGGEERGRPGSRWKTAGDPSIHADPECCSSDDEIYGDNVIDRGDSSGTVGVSEGVGE